MSRSRHCFRLRFRFSSKEKSRRPSRQPSWCRKTRQEITSTWAPSISAKQPHGMEEKTRMTLKHLIRSTDTSERWKVHTLPLEAPQDYTKANLPKSTKSAWKWVIRLLHWWPLSTSNSKRTIITWTANTMSFPNKKSYRERTKRRPISRSASSSRNKRRGKTSRLSREEPFDSRTRCR